MGSSISSLFSGAPSAPDLKTFQPQYTGQADTSAFQGMQSIANNNPYLQNQGIYQSLEQQGLNDPYAAGVQAAGNQAGQQYGQLGQQGMAASSALNQGAMNLLPYVSQVENTAMDPQNALYNRTLSQVQDQAGVTNAQTGVGTSPFGAGVMNSANRNFNIDWQNNQLGRQATGMGAAVQGLAGAGNAMGQAQNIGDAATGDTLASGTTPQQAYLANIGNKMNVLNNYGTSQTNANAQSQTAVGDFMSYMGQGEQQANVQQNLNQTNYQNELAQQAAQNQMWGNIASGGASGLLSAFSGGGGSATGGVSGTGGTDNVSGNSGSSSGSSIAKLMPLVMMAFA